MVVTKSVNHVQKSKKIISGHLNVCLKSAFLKQYLTYVHDNLRFYLDNKVGVLMSGHPHYFTDNKVFEKCPLLNVRIFQRIFIFKPKTWGHKNFIFSFIIRFLQVVKMAARASNGGDIEPCNQMLKNKCFGSFLRNVFNCGWRWRAKSEFLVKKRTSGRYENTVLNVHAVMLVVLLALTLNGISAGGADCDTKENGVRRRTIIPDSIAMGGSGQYLSVRSLSYPTLPIVLAEIGADGNWCDLNYLDPWDPCTYEPAPESKRISTARFILGVVGYCICFVVFGPVFRQVFDLRK